MLEVHFQDSIYKGRHVGAAFSIIVEHFPTEIY